MKQKRKNKTRAGKLNSITNYNSIYLVKVWPFYMQIEVLPFSCYVKYRACMSMTERETETERRYGYGYGYGYGERMKERKSQEQKLHALR